MENSASSENGTTGFKSLDELLNEGLGAENKQALDRLLAEARTMMQSGSKYVEENPSEAIAVAVGVGIAAYIALATKPGRRAVEIAAIAFMPKIKNWVVDFFNKHAVTPMEQAATPAPVDAAQGLHH